MKNKLTKQYGFTVLMKDKTTEEERNKLIEEVIKNKFVKCVEGSIKLDDKKKGGKEWKNQKKIGSQKI